MAIRNINTVQNPTDLAYITNLSNNFMYESLSNLGQRFSVKGDSIKTNYFTTLSVVNKKYDDFVYTDRLLSKLSVIENKLYLQFFDSSDIYNPLYSEELEYTINNLVTTDAPLKLETKINGIDYYKENLYIYLDSNKNTLTISSLGCDTDLGIVELNVECYNIIDNTLVQSLKLIDINDDTNYYIYYLYDEVKGVNDTNFDYTVLKYKIDKKYIDDLYGDFQTYVISIYNTTITEYYKENKTLDISALYYELLQQGFINCCPGSDIVVKYDKDVKGFYVDDEYSSEFNTVLNFIYNQYVYMYSFIFDYYCNYIYKLDNNQLNKHILYKLFVKAYSDSLYNNINQFELFIPVDYEFNYYCKDTDSFYIYCNETPVNIFYTINGINQEFINKFKSNILLATHKLVEKVVLYKFSVNYNSSNDSLINNVNISDLYSTPYIVDGYWVINNQLTNHKAVGLDANNPNIILLFTKNLTLKDNNFTENDYQILSTINNELLNSLSWKKTAVKVNLFDNIDTEKYDSIRSNDYNVNVLIPSDISLDKTSIINQLKGSLIINMSDINNIHTENKTEKESIKNILGDYSFITTFWVFEQSIGSFINIKNPNNITNALTLSNLNNINSIIKNQTDNILNNYLDNIDTSSFTFSYCKFDTGYLPTKNEFDNLSYTYALLYNKSLLNAGLAQYENETSDNVFNNPFIFELKYVSKNLNTLSENFDNVGFIKLNNNSELKIKSNNILAKQLLSNLDNDYIKAYSYDYLPSEQTPLLNLGEVFTINSNTLNRSNICSLDKSGNVYYSYIGTNITDDDKSVLHIGTSNININVGTDSFATSNIIDKFNKQDTISIDFDNICLNSYIVNKPKVEITNICYNLYTAKILYNYSINTASDNNIAHMNYLDGKYNVYSVNSNMNEVVSVKLEQNGIFTSTSYVMIPITNLIDIIKCKAADDFNDKINILLEKSNTYILDIDQQGASNINTYYLFTNKDETLLGNTYTLNLRLNYLLENGYITCLEILTDDKHNKSIISSLVSTTNTNNN